MTWKYERKISNYYVNTFIFKILSLTCKMMILKLNYDWQSILPVDPLSPKSLNTFLILKYWILLCCFLMLEICLRKIIMPLLYIFSVVYAHHKICLFIFCICKETNFIYTLQPLIILNPKVHMCFVPFSVNAFNYTVWRNRIYQVNT